MMMKTTLVVWTVLVAVLPLLGQDAAPAPRIKVLLAVQDLEERTERIQSFLNDSGFACRVVTYAAIRAEDCQASDVILADSKLFGQTKGARKIAHEFPRTDRPIVAVGFLGTELFEAIGIAMTSGYI